MVPPKMIAMIPLTEGNNDLSVANRTHVKEGRLQSMVHVPEPALLCRRIDQVRLVVVHLSQNSF